MGVQQTTRFSSGPGCRLLHTSDNRGFFVKGLAVINPQLLVESDIGRHVVYRTTLTTGYRLSSFGVLSSWNDEYVFVRFRGPNGEACRPEDVSFAVDGHCSLDEDVSLPIADGEQS